MSSKEYIPGDTVFAKLKGYPWWPARVENDKDIPAKILKQKGKSKGLLYTVFFYGSRDYGFFGPDCVRPFDRATVERDLKAKKFKTKDLEIAIHQALDPSILKAEEEAEAAAAAAEEEDDEEEEEEEEEPVAEEDDDEEEEVVKPKRKERKKPVATAADKKKKQPASKKRVTKKIIEEEEEDDDEMEEEVVTKKAKQTNTKKATNEKNKRARLADVDSTENNDRKKRRKSLSTEQEEDHRNNRESSTMSRKSEEPTSAANHGAMIAGGGGHIEKQEELELFKKTPEYKRIYHIRHKLQKLVYEKKPGEIQKEDFIKVSQVVKEIEESNMTYDLLRYTKIGKVVKFACSYDYDNDEYKINQRCQQLMKNWKSLIIPDASSTRSVSAEQTDYQQS